MLNRHYGRADSFRIKEGQKMFTSTVKKCAQITLGAAALSLVVGGAAFAQSVGAELGVSATVTNNCTIAATPTVAVGNYNTLASTINQTGTLAVTCTQGAVATIAMDAGANGASATGTTRAMTDGSHFLSYELYSNPGRTMVWGTAANAVIEDAAPSSAPVDYTVYASVPGAQDVPSGDYTDSVAVTVSF
jgi:spore coat protein U-like protein